MVQLSNLVDGQQQILDLVAVVTELLVKSSIYWSRILTCSYRLSYLINIKRIAIIQIVKTINVYKNDASHFAQLDENNVVTQVIVVGNSDTADVNGVESENIGVAFCRSLGAGTNWKQTLIMGEATMLLYWYEVYDWSCNSGCWFYRCLISDNLTLLDYQYNRGTLKHLLYLL